MTRCFSAPWMELIYLCRQGDALEMRQKRNKEKKIHQAPDVCAWLVIPSKANFGKTIFNEGSEKRLMSS